MAIVPHPTLHPTPCDTTRQILDTINSHTVSAFPVQVDDDSLAKAGIERGDIVFAAPSVLSEWHQDKLKGRLIVARDAGNTLYTGWYAPPHLVRSRDTIPLSGLTPVAVIFAQAL